MRELVKDGADHIKIMASGGGTAITDLRRPSYTVEELRAIVDEAHNMGKPTTAHCLATGSIVNALDAGVDMIEHAGFIEARRLLQVRPPRGGANRQAGHLHQPHSPDRIPRHGSPAEQAGTGWPHARGGSQRLEWAKGKCESQMEFLGCLWSDWQIPIVSGTDAIAAFGDYCIGLEIMAEAGMSNMEVIRSSTSLNAPRPRRGPSRRLQSKSAKTQT